LFLNAPLLGRWLLQLHICIDHMFWLSRKALGRSVCFVERSLVGCDSVGALYRAIWRPGSSRISALKRWKAVKRVSCIWARLLPVFFNVSVFWFRNEMKRSALTICLLWLYSVTCRNIYHKYFQYMWNM